MKYTTIKENSGQTVKNYAKYIWWVTFVPYLIIGLAIFLVPIIISNASYSSRYSFGTFLISSLGAFVAIWIGYWIATILRAFISGYGEIVENTAETASYLQTLLSTLPDKAALDGPALAQSNTNATPQNAETLRADNPSVETQANEQQATFGTPRIQNGFKYCPKCGTKQNSNRTTCYECGCNFTQD